MLYIVNLPIVTINLPVKHLWDTCMELYYCIKSLDLIVRKDAWILQATSILPHLSV